MHELFLNGIIDRIEGDFAVIRTSKTEILWPIEFLPKEAKEGSSISLKAFLEKDETKEREKLAKTILNEILSNTKEASQETDNKFIGE